MEWRHRFTHDLDLEAGILDEYRSFDYHDALENAGPTSWDTTTYKWLCCGGDKSCGTSNTTDLTNKTPHCGGQGCKHRKCSYCTDLKDGDIEMWVVAQPVSSLPPAAPKPPRTRPETTWYCHNCGSGPLNMNLHAHCESCNHARCMYCRIA